VYEDRKDVAKERWVMTEELSEQAEDRRLAMEGKKVAMEEVHRVEERGTNSCSWTQVA
jgi:hypothetical protein